MSYSTQSFTNKKRNQAICGVPFHSMKKLMGIFFFLLSFLVSTQLYSQSTNRAPKWKLGIALYTFHRFSFAEQLAKADSAHIKFVEGFMFSKTGPELKDSMISTLSPMGIEKLKRLIKAKGMQMVSFYVMGGNTVDSWKKQFELAKRFNVRYVTSEPPVDMWNSIDSLAGIYKIKVAIHNHWKGTSKYWHPDSVLVALKGHSNFGVCADVGHWPKSGINPVEGLKKLRGHIIALHLKDIAAYNDPKLKDVVVGTGIIDFPEVFKELKRQNFTGYIMIERDAEEKPSNLPSVTQTINYYNRQMKKLQ